MEETKMRIEDIQVCERHRKDLGDLEGLAASIEEVGLLHPVVVTPDKKLIAGQRRLEAVRRLGWTEVPVRVVTGLEDTLKALVAERDENDCRKPFNPVEAVHIGRKLEAIEKAAAKERQAQAGPSDGPGVKSSGAGKLPEASKGEVRDRVGAAVGMSGRTYEKAKAVVEAAEREPEKYSRLVKLMEETGKVDGAHRQLNPRAKSTASSGDNVKKAMIDRLARKVETQGVGLPLDLQRLHGEKGRAYASKLTELARTLELWAKAMATPTEGPTDGMPTEGGETGKVLALSLV
jgi:ParB family chromosome partitioning protein